MQNILVFGHFGLVENPIHSVLQGIQGSTLHLCDL